MQAQSITGRRCERPQREALALVSTAMAVTIDIGDADNIHPADKQDVDIACPLRQELWSMASMLNSPAPITGP